MNSISNPCYLALFDNYRDILATFELEIKGNESSRLIPELQSFLDENNIAASQLENIVVVNGPGSFTGVRTTVLIANTLNYVIQKNMTAISYFDLFSKYPIVKSSSKRDCFAQKNHGEKIEIILNNDLDNYFIENNIYEGFGEAGFDFNQTTIVEKIDYSRIIKNIEFQKSLKIEPLYIKKPNIS